MTRIDLVNAASMLKAAGPTNDMAVVDNTMFRVRQEVGKAASMGQQLSMGLAMRAATGFGQAWTADCSGAKQRGAADSQTNAPSQPAAIRRTAKLQRRPAAQRRLW